MDEIRQRELIQTRRELQPRLVQRLLLLKFDDRRSHIRRLDGTRRFFDVGLQVGGPRLQVRQELGLCCLVTEWCRDRRGKSIEFCDLLIERRTSVDRRLTARIVDRVSQRDQRLKEVRFPRVI